MITRDDVAGDDNRGEEIKCQAIRLVRAMADPVRAARSAAHKVIQDEHDRDGCSDNGTTPGCANSGEFFLHAV